MNRLDRFGNHGPMPAATNYKPPTPWLNTIRGGPTKWVGNAPPSETMGTAAKIASYLFAIFLVVLLLLIFVHFFITPIFQLHPGGPGMIPIPGGDDGTLFWDTTNTGQILNKDLPISTQSFNYSLLLDVFIENPMQFSTIPRIILTRGAHNKTPAPTSGLSITDIIDNYNLVIALMPDTTDLVVSVLNTSNNMENVILPNIPTQEAFRLGIVIMENALEVYLNGKLIKTRTFTSPPKHVLGDIFPSPAGNMAKLHNLKLWPRLLTTSEIRYAKPALASASAFGAGSMPSTSMCGLSTLQDGAADAVNNAMSSASSAASSAMSSASSTASSAMSSASSAMGNATTRLSNASFAF